MTNLREPVSRSISHFKYEGRWDCKQLTANKTYVPTEDNAKTLEEWSEDYGRYGGHMFPCAYAKSPKKRYFKMLTCGVMCYSQWFAGLSCPREGTLPLKQAKRKKSLMQQFEVARSKLRRYNFIVISEWLHDPGYVAAVERYFGVPGVAQRAYYPWCERESHAANNMIPLAIKNETMQKLTRSNLYDKYMYDEFSDCLKYRRKKDFPKWDASRFEMNETIQMDYKLWERRNPPFKSSKYYNKNWTDHPSNQKYRIVIESGGVDLNNIE